MGTERRFILLVALALGLLAALGTATRSSSREEIAPSTADQSQPATASSATVATTVASPSSIAEPPLAGLWSTNLRDRSPRLVAPAHTTIIDNKQIISYYGNPYTPDMGVLGTADLETIGAELEARAARYDQLNGDMGTVPAIHLVYAVAQYHPTNNGLYLQYVDDQDVRRYLEYTQRHNMLLFLDLQIGQSSVAAEIRKALPYLRYPHVHLAIDPEFAVSATQIPGSDLGSLHSADIGEAQSQLQQLVDEDGLPPKILIVHQFADSMLQDADGIRSYSNVALVVDMDGFGAAAIKRATYEQLAARPYAANAAIKLFFHDDPDMMSEEDVLRLQPTPTIVIYQ